jgi:hypothetical protein
MSTIDLSAPVRDIQIDQGSSAEIPFYATRSGNPLEMTGWTLRAQFRKSLSATDTVINGTLSNGILAWVDAAQGRFKLVFTPLVTSYAGNPKVMFSKESPDELELVYDIEAETPAGIVYKICKGTLTIHRESTR